MRLEREIVSSSSSWQQKRSIDGFSDASRAFPAMTTLAEVEWIRGIGGKVSRKSVKSRNRVETEWSFVGWRAVGIRIILSERMERRQGMER